MSKRVEKYKRVYPKLLDSFKKDKDSMEVKDLQGAIALLFEKMTEGEKIDAINWWAKEYKVIVPWNYSEGKK